MINNQNSLVNGYKILIEFEKRRNFYISLLEIIFSNLNDKILIKLCCSSFIVFIRKNWADENFIENAEKTVKFKSKF